MINPTIIANGGAGGINYPARREHGLIRAVKLGYEMLKGGGSSLDAVERAVMVLEDEKVFNAGTGSAFNFVGEVEMDASIMTSEFKFGAVAAIKNVKNPISVARLIMEKTDHLLLCGEGAIRFARAMGIRYYNPKTKERRKFWLRTRANLKSDYFKKLSELAKSYETVGVVAIDKDGLITVGTSTGGISLHLPGRIGDTPVIGGGTYADKNGGASTTGHGEMIMKLLLAFHTVQLMARYSAPIAGRMAIDDATKNGCRCGVIGIDKKGRILCINNTKAMSWCYIKDGNLRTFKAQTINQKGRL